MMRTAEEDHLYDFLIRMCNDTAQKIEKHKNGEPLKRIDRSILKTWLRFTYDHIDELEKTE